MPRNINGNYVLPSGNPVITQTLIESDGWANPTFADIAAALTESLDRNGRGGMLAPFRVADGIVTAPGLSFNSESASGMWRPGAGALSFSVLGVEALRMNATDIALLRNVTVSGAIHATGATTLDGNLGVKRTPAATVALDVIGSIRGQGGAAAGADGYGLRLLNAAGTTGGSLTVSEAITGMTIAGDGGPLTFATGGVERVQLTDTGAMLPKVDGAYPLGFTGNEWFGFWGRRVQRSSAGDLSVIALAGNIILSVSSTDTVFLQQAGNLQTIGQIRASGWWNTPNGVLGGTACEIGVSAGVAAVTGFDRTAGVYRPLRVNAATVELWTLGTQVMALSGAGSVGIGMTPVDYGAGIAALQLNSTSQSIYDLYFGGVRKAFFCFTGTNCILGTLVGTTGLDLWTGGAARAGISVAGVFTYAGFEVGWRDAVLNEQTAPYVLNVTDRGKAVVPKAGCTSVSLAAMPPGTVITLANYSGAPVAIVSNGITMVWSGPGSVGDRTLLTASIATIFWGLGTTVLITGGIA